MVRALALTGVLPDALAALQMPLATMELHLNFAGGSMVGELGQWPHAMHHLSLALQLQQPQRLRQLHQRPMQREHACMHVCTSCSVLLNLTGLETPPGSEFSTVSTFPPQLA